MLCASSFACYLIILIFCTLRPREAHYLSKVLSQYDLNNNPNTHFLGTCVYDFTLALQSLSEESGRTTKIKYILNSVLEKPQTPTKRHPLEGRKHFLLLQYVC